MNPIIADRANDFGLLARGRCCVTLCGRSNSASSLAGAFSRHGSVSMPVSPQCDQDDGSFLLSFESQCQLCKSPVTSSAIPCSSSASSCSSSAGSCSSSATPVTSSAIPCSSSASSCSSSAGSCSSSAISCSFRLARVLLRLFRVLLRGLLNHSERLVLAYTLGVLRKKKLSSMYDVPPGPRLSYLQTIVRLTIVMRAEGGAPIVF